MRNFIENNQKNITKFFLVIEILFAISGIVVSALPFLDPSLKIGLVFLLVAIPPMLNGIDYYIKKKITNYIYKDWLVKFGMSFGILPLILGFVLSNLFDPTSLFVLAIGGFLAVAIYTYLLRKDIFFINQSGITASQQLQVQHNQEPRGRLAPGATEQYALIDDPVVVPIPGRPERGSVSVDPDPNPRTRLLVVHGIMAGSPSFQQSLGHPLLPNENNGEGGVLAEEVSGDPVLQNR